jgi:TRAP-type C4-dicarboxylate transport system permease large subunit
MITPPIGLNVFVLNGVRPDIPLGVIFRGIFPFVLAGIAQIIILIMFPALATFLPELLAN